MTRKRKVLLGAVATLGAVALAIASAGAHTAAKFQFEGTSTEILSKVDGVHEIEIPSYGTMVCQRADFWGTVKGTSATSIALDPYLTECKVGAEDVTFTSGGCQFQLKADGGLTIASRPGENCSTSPMEITAAEWVVLIPEQNLTGIGYTNINKEEQITFSMTITKLKGSRFGKAPETEFTAGQYKTGNSIIYGREDPGQNTTPIKWVATVP